MKKVLITAKNSFVGNEVAKYLDGKYEIEKISLRVDNWKNVSFAGVDCIFHVAGIAHIKETKENTHLYYDVNERLSIAVAEKAKAEGVKHFIVLSTMNVYGLTTGHITKNTRPNPVMIYGKSKLNADLAIEKMECPTFKVAILRPPMIYGQGCKGNYQTLRKFALKSPIFPSYKNERSMLFVGNLAAFVEGLIEKQKRGLFFPQDVEYVCTSDMVKKIDEQNGKRIKTIGMFNWAISFILGLGVGVFKKVFGSLTYEKVDLVTENSFEEAIKMTEQ